ncbi:hypothetical protein [Kitasatospora sp. NPDC059571]|uniref:hypothetical protein n=1 Tax=Kitasatospora sp. NPDC059571 TaxID=3346871 RepID=UPI0036B35A01
MSSAARPRIGRSYTRARRHPWVLGKLGDWRIPMGPYTPPQLAVASIGAFALIKTFTWWAPVLGPLPVVAWGVAIWAARHSRIGGRSPFLVVLDAAALAIAPRAGRIAGRAARPMRPVLMNGSFFIEEDLDPDSTSSDSAGSVVAEEAPASPTAPTPPAATAPPHGSPRPQPVRSTAAASRTRRASHTAGPQPAAPSGPALTPLQQMLAAAAAANPTGDQQ